MWKPKYSLFHSESKIIKFDITLMNIPIHFIRSEKINFIFNNMRYTFYVYDRVRQFSKKFEVACEYKTKP